MPDFRTPVNISPSGFSVDHRAAILLTGSCFTAHIGAYLERYKFRNLTNPLGIIYNPVSLAKSITAKPDFRAADFFENEGRWRHWDLHSELAHPDLETAVQLANETAAKTADFLKKADILVFTLGTASVFNLVSTGETVANCHKMPARMFERKRLTVEQTTQVLSEAITAVRALRPALKVILTVSPVRHLRDGAIENQRSKAVLVLACEALTRAFENVCYFPSYELLLDDLRDYRFYAADMIHPSETAVQYIWEQFAQIFFSPATQVLNGRIEKITAAAQHRPFNPQSAQHQDFVKKQLAAIGAITAEFPGLDFSAEQAIFTS